MKTKMLMVWLSVLALVAVGCVSTVSGNKRAGVPFLKDTVEGRYQRSVEQVYTAAKDAIHDMGGTVNLESTIHNETNSVKTITGKLNLRHVYVRVEPAETEVTAVAVQARTQGGNPDVALAHEIEKQIALKLVLTK